MVGEDMGKDILMAMESIMGMEVMENIHMEDMERNIKVDGNPMDRVVVMAKRVMDGTMEKRNMDGTLDMTRKAKAGILDMAGLVMDMMVAMGRKIMDGTAMERKIPMGGIPMERRMMDGAHMERKLDGILDMDRMIKDGTHMGRKAMDGTLMERVVGI